MASALQIIGVRNPFTIGQLPLPMPIVSVRDDLERFYWATLHDKAGRFECAGNGKLKIDSKRNLTQFNEVLERSTSATNDLVSHLMSDSFKKRILGALWWEIIKCRRDRYFFELLLFKMFGVDPFETRVEFSWMPVGASIVPHTDSVGKIFSGLIYLQDENDSHLATRFWDYSEKNYENKHLEKTSDKSEFFERAISMQSPQFDSDCMYFFIRNSRSWHSVDVVTHNDPSYVRITINYNIFIRGSIVKKIVKKIFGLS